MISSCFKPRLGVDENNATTIIYISKNQSFLLSLSVRVSEKFSLLFLLKIRSILSFRRSLTSNERRQRNELILTSNNKA